MRLIKEWKEGDKLPNGLSYRRFDGTAFNMRELCLRSGRVGFRAGWSTYFPEKYGPTLAANPISGSAYRTLDFKIMVM